MAEKIIQVAVLGQGRSGYDIHVNWLRRVPQQYKVVAVADQLPERHEAVEQLGAKGYTDYRQLLADRDLKLDLVVNALPSHLHGPATIEALEAGHNVLCEKPLAVTLKDFDAMVAAAEKAGRRLFAFQNSRFNPAFQKVREVLDSGRLGKLVHARISFSGFARRWDWQASQRYGGGNLNNTGPHPLDQAIVLFGDRTPRVFSSLKCENEFGDADNFASVSLHGPDAPLIEVVVSSFMAYPQGDVYNLSCTQGGLAGGFKELKWKYFDPAKAPRQAPMQGWSEKRQYVSEQLPWVEESWQNDPDADLFSQISRGLYDDLYNTLTRGSEPAVKLSEVRRQVAVIEQCHRDNPLPRKL